MNLPTIKQFKNQALHTAKRFPLALAAAIAATVVTIILVEVENAMQQAYLINIIAASVLGISLFTAIPLITERKNWGSSTHISVYIVGVILLTVFYFLLPNEYDYVLTYHLYRFILYFIAVHLLVAIGPYLGENRIESFWQYNKLLFLRILTAILFSGVLFIGLAAALGAIEFLFNVSISYEWYLELFLIIAGIFNTWFFLAGIPHPIQKMDSVTSYPKGLKVFTTNVLLPLVIIYMIILYLYAIKIITQWAWPQGWVSTLILFFSIFGILANLLLYPLRSQTENRWVKRFPSPII